MTNLFKLPSLPPGCECRGTCYATPEAIAQRDIRPCSEGTHLYENGGWLCACAEEFCPDDLSALTAA